MKYTLILLAFVFLASCQSKEEVEVQQSIDSLVVPQAPVNTATPTAIDTASGLLIDRSRMRTPEHRQTLARFHPKEISQVYRNFRPLRKEGLDQPRLDSFLKANKVSLTELKTILSEGDQLGWNTVDSSGFPIK